MFFHACTAALGLVVCAVVSSGAEGAKLRNFAQRDTGHRLLDKKKKRPILDLSEDFVRSPLYNDSKGARALIEFAEKEPEIRGFIVLEHGVVVAEYYDSHQDDTTLSLLWSVTKSWTSLLFGVMEREGLISIEETLGDIWPDEYPYDAIWSRVKDAHTKKKISIKSLLTMTSGLSMPSLWFVSALTPFDDGHFGGFDFLDSLKYHKYSSSSKGNFEYLPAGNLMSYILKTRTGLTPEEYAMKEVFPLLGISDKDYDWHTNKDEVSYAWHGLIMTIPAMAKLGMLYLQGGLANPGGGRVVDKSWVDRSTAGTTAAPFYGYNWWITGEGEYCAGGFGGQAICVDENQQRILAITSDNYIPDLAGGFFDSSEKEMWSGVRLLSFSNLTTDGCADDPGLSFCDWVSLDSSNRCKNLGAEQLCPITCSACI